MDDKNNIRFGRQRKDAEKSRSESKRPACIVAAYSLIIFGAIFCAVFLGGNVKNEVSDTSNHSFEAVYAMAEVSEVSGGDSVLTASLDDGEWSFWAYLEYVISKFIGDV